MNPVEMTAAEHDVSEDMGQMQQAALQLAVGFERAAAITDRSKKIESMREASAALLEMRIAVNAILGRLVEP